MLITNKVKNSFLSFLFDFRLILTLVFFGVVYCLLTAVFAPVYRVDVKLSGDHNDFIKIYEWNGLRNQRFQEQYSYRSKLFLRDKIQVVSIRHAPYSLKAIRINPGVKTRVIKIYAVTLYNSLLGGRIYAAKDIYENFTPNADIGQYELKGDHVIVQITGKNPSLTSEHNLPPIHQAFVVMLALAFSFVVFLLSNNMLVNSRKLIASLPYVSE